MLLWSFLVLFVSFVQGTILVCFDNTVGEHERPTREGPEEVGKACTLACVSACMSKLKDKTVCDNFCSFSLHIASEHFDELKTADPTQSQIVGWVCHLQTHTTEICHARHGVLADKGWRSL